MLSAVLLPTLQVGVAFGAPNPSVLIVEELPSDSQGAKAGLQAGDRIVSYDWETVASPHALQAVQENTLSKGMDLLELRRREERLRVAVPR